MYVVDSRNPAYVIAWLINFIVLVFQGLTYVVIVQPPDTPSLSSYREAFAAVAVCNADPSTPGYETLNSDVRECGVALSTQTGVADAHAALLFMVINALFVNELAYVPLVHAEKHIFHREHAAAAYSTTAWHLAWLLKMAFSAALKTILYPPAFYFLSKLHLSFESYLTACFISGGMGFAGSATAMVVTSAIPSYAAASTTFTFLVLAMQNVCGFYIAIEVIPEFISWT
eukprot:527035-Pleurochrysis_carterae.AAC.1